MKSIVKMPCTDASCKHNHEMIVDSEALGLKADPITIPSATVTQLSTIPNTYSVNTAPPPQPKTITHEDMANMLPKGVNFTRCTGEDCGKKIKNAKGLVTKFKTCENCERNAVPASKKDCPFCGKKFESDEEPDIDDISDKVEDEDEE